MQTGLFRQLLAVAPVLDLPDAASREQHQQQRTAQFPCRRTHGTSLKKTWWPSFSVCFALAAQAGAFGMVVARIDFVCYWPGMPLFIKRAYRDEVMIRKLGERVKTFYEILDERMNKVQGLAA